MVKTEYGDSFVIADIPGIIEGASEGVGLGLQFLRHIERTRLLLHVIDVSGSEGRNPVDDFEKINSELKKYSKKLRERTQIIVANKSDIIQDEEKFEELSKLAQKHNIKIFKISAVTGEGISELIKYVSDLLKTLPKEELLEYEDKKIYKLENKDDYTIRKEEGMFVIEGEPVERIMRRVNIDDNESLYYLQKNLDELGVHEKLKKMGIKEGDIVKIADYELEWED